MRRLWWCSFADASGPLGVVVTPDDEDGDVVELAARLWRMGVNPGGELLAGSAPRRNFLEADAWALEPQNQDRLISISELKQLGAVLADVYTEGNQDDE